jgi:hypothetical protein
MIKRYNQFVSGKVNEEFEMDNFENEAPIVEEPIVDNENPEVEEAPEAELPEEEGGEYQGQILLNQLANELGTEVDADGSINYEGKKINFYSETEKFHVDNKKFSTAEEVVNYLGSNEAPKMTADEENEMTGEREGERRAGVDIEDVEDWDNEDEKFESKSYRHTRLKKFGK